MSDDLARFKVRELGYDLLVGEPDPEPVAEPKPVVFRELAEEYLTRRPFNKQSTKELHEQVVRNVLIPKWGNYDVLEIRTPELKKWFLALPIERPTRGKYKIVMSCVFKWGMCEELIPQQMDREGLGIVSSDPCSRIKAPEFSQTSDYEALALEVEDTFALLSHLKQPEYVCTLLVSTCGFRASEALGLKWRDILWDKKIATIRQTVVHGKIQDGAKTRLSRSRVEIPQLALDQLARWRRETVYAADDDWIFASIKLGGKKPRTPTMLVQDYLYPAALKAGILVERDEEYYSKDGDLVKRFGFHNLGRHSLATFLMDEQENPAVVQAVMRHAQMDMTLYYSHSQRKQKRAALDNYAARLFSEKKRVQVPANRMIQ
jgi:integrase